MTNPNLVVARDNDESTDAAAPGRNTAISGLQWLDTAVRWLAILAGVVLTGLVLLTFADVVMRYLFSAPIAGRQDVVELGMVAVLSLAAPYAWRLGEHITVDVLPDFPWRWARVARTTMVRLMVVALLGLLSYTAYQRIEEAALFNEATNIILIPHQPFLVLMTVAFALHLFIVVAELIADPRR